MQWFDDMVAEFGDFQEEKVQAATTAGHDRLGVRPVAQKTVPNKATAAPEEPVEVTKPDTPSVPSSALAEPEEVTVEATSTTIGKKKKKAGRKPKSFDNREVYDYLAPFITLGRFNIGAPKRINVQVHDILTGVSRLNFGGNTRPLSRRALFNLLANLPEISTEAVMDYHRCSERHARKIATALRIVSQSLARCIRTDSWAASFLELRQSGKRLHFSDLPMSQECQHETVTKYDVEYPFLPEDMLWQSLPEDIEA